MINKKKVLNAIDAIFPSRIIKLFRSCILSEECLSKNRDVVNSNIIIERFDRIVWFIPSISSYQAGGIFTVLKMADFYSRRESCLNYFVLNEIPNKETIQSISKEYPELKFLVVSKKNIESVPNCCIGICTFWTTAFDLVKFNKCKKKIYLIQDDEREFYSKSSLYELVESTYRFGFKGLTNSSVIGSRYKEISKSPVHVYIPPMDPYLVKCREHPRTNDVINVVVYARPSHSRNCFESIVVSISEVAKSLGDRFVFNFVGEDFSKKEFQLPNNCNVIGNVKNKLKLANIYANSHFGISFINTPTITYQQLDIIQSGICLITNYNQSLMERYSEDEVYYVHLAPHELIPSLKFILKDLDERERKIALCSKKTNCGSWDDSFSKIDEFLKEE